MGKKKQSNPPPDFEKPPAPPGPPSPSSTDEREATILPCAGCGRGVIYEPPYPTDEQLCDECVELIAQMQRDGEL